MDITAYNKLSNFNKLDKGLIINKKIQKEISYSLKLLIDHLLQIGMKTATSNIFHNKIDM